ncbi:TPA: hypothetical protein NDT38_002427, partial [Enterococcus faecium]|nr:hypothetical protein [Enterococcus faecium]
SKYFDNYLNSADHYDVEKVLLLNELLKVVFNKVDLSLYITMENFRNYYSKKIHNLLDLDDDSFMINFFKEYALMGDCVSTISENLFKDTEWTRNLLMSIYISRYPIFTDEDRLNKLSQGISSTIESVELDTKGQKKLNYLKQKIDMLINL